MQRNFIFLRRPNDMYALSGDCTTCTWNRALPTLTQGLPLFQKWAPFARWNGHSWTVFGAAIWFPTCDWRHRLRLEAMTCRTQDKVFWNARFFHPLWSENNIIRYACACCQITQSTLWSKCSWNSLHFFQSMVFEFKFIPSQSNSKGLRYFKTIISAFSRYFEDYHIDWKIRIKPRTNTYSTHNIQKSCTTFSD